jgi:hypothetical protein
LDNPSLGLAVVLLTTALLFAGVFVLAILSGENKEKQ